MRIAMLLALVALSLSSTAQAADRKIDDFFGRWLGTGEATQGSAKTQSRDSEVIIERAADGFKISWTTMSSDVTAPTRSKVKTALLTFKPGGKPGYFVDVKAGNPLDGKKSTWARVAGDTLSINQLVVGDDGQWDVSVYDRTLKDQNSMELAFTRITNGKIARQASLKMTRAKD
ncbi:MAG: hypothetical protein GC190_14500 [Alphaproteobacteria bacterium]|nr:hypothetical protein [Alphaproteobacteria bacterium]